MHSRSYCQCFNLTDLNFYPSFYNIIYDDDRSAFDGQNVYQDISQNLSFQLPFEHDVMAGIAGAQEDVMEQ